MSEDAEKTEKQSIYDFIPTCYQYWTEIQNILDISILSGIFLLYQLKILHMCPNKNG